MKLYTAKIESTTPIIFSRQLDIKTHPKKEREQAGDYDERLWKEKAHYAASGNVLIPAVYFKRALEEIAKFLGIQIPGKAKATYTKHFEAGLQMVGEGIDTGVYKDSLNSIAISCNADGKRGSGTRVTRRFPTIPKWSGEINIWIADEIITEPILLEHLNKAGMLIGIGSFRLRKGNSGGGFKVVSLTETNI
jgi:hypothetical protein